MHGSTSSGSPRQSLGLYRRRLATAVMYGTPQAQAMLSSGNSSGTTTRTIMPSLMWMSAGGYIPPTRDQCPGSSDCSLAWHGSLWGYLHRLPERLHQTHLRTAETRVPTT